MSTLTTITWAQAMPADRDEKQFFKDLGARIAERRRAQAITQVQLAEALGVSQQTVTAYESGRRRMPVSSLPFIARFLGTTIEELMGEQSPPAPRSAARRRCCSRRSSASRDSRRQSKRSSSRYSTACSTRPAAKRNSSPWNT